jgi:acetyltransferase-like isoleucine patch superfamily enzyme
LGIAALLPQWLKRVVYRWVFGYRISSRAWIGIAFLDCEQLTVGEGARIGHGAVFLRCGEVRIGNHVRVGPLNLFAGGKRVDLEDYSQVLRFNFINAIREHDCTNEPDSSFYLGYGAVITAEHRVDFTDRVRIGRRSILAGRNSSIWTHNIRTGRPVEIGDYCYVGSESRFAPGASVPDCCVVGLGSVVTRPLEQGWSLVAGVPAQHKRSLTEEDYELIFGKTRSDLPDEVTPLPQAEATPARGLESACGARR